MSEISVGSMELCVYSVTERPSLSLTSIYGHLFNNPSSTEMKGYLSPWLVGTNELGWGAGKS